MLLYYHMLNPGMPIYHKSHPLVHCHPVQHPVLPWHMLAPGLYRHGGISCAQAQHQAPYALVKPLMQSITIVMYHRRKDKQLRLLNIQGYRTRDTGFRSPSHEA